MGGGGGLKQYLGIHELLRVFKIPKIHTLFRTYEKTHAVLFYSNLLAIAIEQIHVIVIALDTLSTNKFHRANQINRAGNLLIIRTLD